MNVIIIDDELLARRLTREYLSHHADINIIGEEWQFTETT